MEKKYYIVTDDRNEFKVIYADKEEAKMQPNIGGKWKSRTGGFDTMEDLKARTQVSDEPCVCCGGWITTQYHTYPDFKHTGLCFYCYHTQAKLDDPKTYIINGEMYTDGGRQEGNIIMFQGHGGREFKIERNDGTIVETNNLWYGGHLTENFRKNNPNNAKFL